MTRYILKRKFRSMKMFFCKKFEELIPSRVGRLIVGSVFSFCVGATVCVLSVTIVDNIQKESGVGGLETTGVPEFTQGVFSDENTNALDDNLEATTALLSDESSPSENLNYFMYRVKSGDMIGIIADNFGITQDTIISVNSIKQSRLLQVGQYLKIPSMPGILYTVKEKGETLESIATKFEVNADKCSRVNSFAKNVSLDEGITLFVPDAELDWVTRQEINGDLFRRPLKGRYYLSSYYGWRKSPFTGARSFHSGIDMAASQGTAIYAALAGRVVEVGYNDVYGNYVIISHHSGYKTLYGHMQKSLVVYGKYVDTNTRIGLVGNTGQSTGPHLHFTVFKGGKTVNPFGLLQ